MKKKIMVIFALLVMGLMAGRYIYAEKFPQNNMANNEESSEMVSDEDIPVPAMKIGSISMDAGTLLRAALERVWLTKYFGAPAEIFAMPTNRPLCEALPESHPDQDAKNGVFIWWHKCVPVEIAWKANWEEKTGTGTIRMLDFEGADEVLEEVFEIIRTNSLGAYKIDKSQIDAVKTIIEEKSEFYNADIVLDVLKTYSNLERRYIPDDTLNVFPDVASEKKRKETGKYFSHRGRKYALTLGYGNLPDLHIAMNKNEDLLDMMSEIAGADLETLFSEEFGLHGKIHAFDAANDNEIWEPMTLLSRAS